nr:MAG TPA: hypothetical protein [Caudoviricetes sp.]
MRKWLVRLVNSNNNVIDGEVYTAENPDNAIMMYKERCERLGIQKCVYDSYTVEPWKFD